MKIFPLSALCLVFSLPSVRGDEAPFVVKPLKYRTSWVGNSFGGDGGPNGSGYWVQNGADEIDVTPDGTVFAGVGWDEAGRCAGLYKDGGVNRILLKEHDGKGKETAWGFGTANNALAASGEHLYVANTGKMLLRFHWKPGDLESARFVDEVSLDGEAVGLTARGDQLVVVYPGGIETRKASDLSVKGRFSLEGATDLAIAADGSFWVLSKNEVRHVAADGKSLDAAVPGLQKPSALSIDPKERLLICDDGPRQQVLIYDVSGSPRLLSTFGDEGGLRSGKPGEVAPRKLFALRGAGVDSSGNLYVAMGFGGQPAGNLILRSFDPEGKLRWELISTAFVDTFGFDPESDGTMVYSRTAIFELDLTAKKPGAEWRLKGISLDHQEEGVSDRFKHGGSALLRNLGGRRLLAMIGQYGGGYRLYSFDEPGGLVARPSGKISAEGETWAWDIDDDGAIWHGDASGRTIKRFSLVRWTKEGKPEYDVEHPRSWPLPEDFELARRVIYEKSTDSLYLFGYLKGQEIDSWGVVGKTARCYDGWLKGEGGPKVRWTIAMPVNPKGSDKGTPLTPSGVDVAGDYLFVGMVKPDEGTQYNHVLRLTDGAYVGSLAPGPEVGGSAGWQDMPFSIQALKRRDGEYLVLVEEDFRGKNLLYRWRPETEDKPAKR